MGSLKIPPFCLMLIIFSLTLVSSFKMSLFTNVCSNILAKRIFFNPAKCLSSRGIKRFVAPNNREIIRRQKLVKPLDLEKYKRSKYIEWNYNAEIFAFGKRLGEEFKIEFLLQAFIHRSYVIQEELRQEQVGIENPSLSMNDNQELSKNGEEIISAKVKKFLSAKFPRLPLEGILSIHNYLLSNEVLANISKNLGTTDIILSADYPVEEATLAKTLKAIVGALAVSQSIERANQFVQDFVLTYLAESDINDFYVIDEPLKSLADILARDNRGAPEPRLIGQSAMNEILATYTVAIYSDQQFLGQGPGETVDIAIEMAARDALKRLFHTSDASSPLDFNQHSDENPVANLKLSSWTEANFRA